MTYHDEYHPGEGVSEPDFAEICECPDCGRTHKKMPFSNPPYGLQRRQLVRLSLLFNMVCDLHATDDQQINDWLKERLRKAYKNGDETY